MLVRLSRSHHNSPVIRRISATPVHPLAGDRGHTRITPRGSHQGVSPRLARGPLFVQSIDGHEDVPDL